jgi:hypothetical protein
MNKKYLAFGFIGLFMVAFAAAAIAMNFATVQTDIEAEALITLDQDLFTFDGEEILNDGKNHYLLIKGENHLDVEIPADVVITITKDGETITDATGIHIAVDAGGDMHYTYEESYNPSGDDWMTWMLNNADWFDWVGTETYELSGFESPVTNHAGNSWYTVTEAGGTWENGVLTLPGIDPDSGLLAALLVIRADFGVELGTYVVKVEINPVSA